MTDLPRPFSGQARVDRPVLEFGPLAPWHATVKVTPVHLARGVTFQVLAEWTGPPAVGMPSDTRPGLRQDIYATGDLQLAKAIANLVAGEFGRGVVPDMREHAARVRDRLSAGPYG